MLTLNKKYYLVTKNKSIAGVNVIVNGIINYDETKQESFSVKVLAINEKIIFDNSENDYDTYFKDIAFYLCKDIKTNDIYIVWDDVVDYTLTTQLNTLYNYDLKILMNSNTDLSVESVITDIKSYVLSKYKTKLTMDITYNNTDNSVSTLETYETQIEEYKNILNNLKLLEPVLNNLNAIKSIDVGKKFTEINDNLKEIQSTLGYITSIMK